MASPRESDLSNGRETRETSVSELFKYEISYGIDQTLQWDPPASSRELAIALSYHFPTEKDLEAKMRAATKKFMREERRKSLDASAKRVFVSRIPETKPSGHDVSYPRSPKVSSRQVTAGPNRKSLTTAIPPTIPATKKQKVSPSPKIFKMLAWDPLVKGFKGNGGRKRRYEKEEGEKVAANRGYACDEHRRQKIKCDPEFCPKNKQRLKLQGNGRETVTERKESSCPKGREINSEIYNQQEPTIIDVWASVLAPDFSRISSQPGLGTEQSPAIGPTMFEYPADIDTNSIVTREESRGGIRTEDRVPSFPPPAFLFQSGSENGGISNDVEREFTHVNPSWLDMDFIPDYNGFFDDEFSSMIIPESRGFCSPMPPSHYWSSSSAPPALAPPCPPQESSRWHSASASLHTTTTVTNDFSDSQDVTSSLHGGSIKPLEDRPRPASRSHSKRHGYLKEPLTQSRGRGKSKNRFSNLNFGSTVNTKAHSVSEEESSSIFSSSSEADISPDRRVRRYYPHGSTKTFNADSRSSTYISPDLGGGTSGYPIERARKPYSARPGSGRIYAHDATVMPTNEDADVETQLTGTFKDERLTPDKDKPRQVLDDKNQPVFVILRESKPVQSDAPQTELYRETSAFTPPGAYHRASDYVPGELLACRSNYSTATYSSASPVNSLIQALAGVSLSDPYYGR